MQRAQASNAGSPVSEISNIFLFRETIILVQNLKYDMAAPFQIPPKLSDIIQIF